MIAPSLRMGGIERAMSTLANYFVSSKDCEVHFITVWPFQPFFNLDERVILHNPPYSDAFETNRSVDKLIYYIRVLSPLGGYVSKLVRKIGPDSVICFGDWFPHVIMLGLKGRYPFYYANRSNPNIKYSKIHEIIRTLAYKLYPPTGIIAQTSLAKERKLRILGRGANIRVIPNPARKVIHYSNIERDNIIISVGRLHHEKGFDRLIKVFAMLNAPDWKLYIVGDGLYFSTLSRLVEELQLGDRVIFTGVVKNVDEYLAKSKIYVMASYQEGFPNALCEAMSAGLACVSFDIVAGPRDIIEDGVNGYLVENNNLSVMADKIQYLIDNPDYISLLGRQAEIITDRFSLNTIGDEYYQFVTAQQNDEKA